MPPVSIYQILEPLERRMERIEETLKTVLTHLGLPQTNISEGENDEIAVKEVSDVVTSSKTEQENPGTVNSSVYSYPALDTSRNEIRILALRKSDEDTDPVKGETLIVSLDENGKTFGICRDPLLRRVRSARLHYFALSYTWGDLEKKGSINLDGHELSITSNLEAALRQMRKIQPQWGGKESYWWIDAICINQEHMLERNQQVSMMRRIYKNSGGVHVWLGVEAGDSAIGMSVIQRLSQLPKLEPGEPDIQYPSEPEGQKLLHWKAVATLSQRQWWERIWVRQEVALGKWPQVHCGSSVIPLQSVIEILRRVKNTVDWLGFDPLQEMESRTSDTSTTKSTFRVPPYLQAGLLFEVTNLHFNKFHNLGDLMFWTRSCKATDLRDKLFSIIGLANPEIHGIKPDYRLSLDDLMKRAARSIIEDKKSLDHLRWCQNPERRNGIPSWVPDVVDEWKAWPFEPLPYTHNYRNTDYTFDENNPDILRISGRYSDSIRLLGGNIIQQDSTIEQLETQFSSWKSFASEAPVPGTMAAELKKLYMEEIRKGELVHGKPPGGTYDSDWASFLYSSTRYIEAVQDDLRGSKSDKAWASFLSLGHDHYDEQRFEREKELPLDRVGDRFFKGLLLPDHFLTKDVPHRSVHRYLRRFGVGRRLGITTVGMLILVPGDAREGDMICEFRSANFPLLLRKQDEHHLLVGEACKSLTSFLIATMS